MCGGDRFEIKISHFVKFFYFAIDNFICQLFEEKKESIKKRIKAF